tara:strand:+ start:350 stop:910 length:561 start_codon:yes stop_codon:yes gene_type:complete
MASLNRIVLLGSVASEIDVKATHSGESVANFTLLVNRPERADGVQSQSDRIQIVCWSDLALQAQALAKNKMVLIEGQIHNRQYDDQNGVRHYVTEVIAKTICNMGIGNQLDKGEQLSGIGEIPQSDNNFVTSDNNSKGETLESQPIEILSKPKESFDFSDSSSASMNTPIESPPEFGEPVEEDIPF